MYIYFLISPLLCPTFCTSQGALWGSCVDIHRFLSAYVSFRPEVRPSSLITAKTLSPTSLNTKFALPHSLVAISLPRTSGPEKLQLIFLNELGVSDLRRICTYGTDFWSVWHDLLVSVGIRYKFLSPAPEGLKFLASNSGHLRPGSNTDAYRIRGRVPRRDGCLAKENGHCSPRNRISISQLLAFKGRPSLCWKHK